MQPPAIAAAWPCYAANAALMERGLKSLPYWAAGCRNLQRSLSGVAGRLRATWHRWCGTSHLCSSYPAALAGSGAVIATTWAANLKQVALEERVMRNQFHPIIRKLSAASLHMAGSFLTEFWAAVPPISP